MHKSAIITCAQWTLREWCILLPLAHFISIDRLEKFDSLSFPLLAANINIAEDNCTIILICSQCATFHFSLETTQCTYSKLISVFCLFVELSFVFLILASHHHQWGCVLLPLWLKQTPHVKLVTVICIKSRLVAEVVISGDGGSAGTSWSLLCSA